MFYALAKPFGDIRICIDPFFHVGAKFIDRTKSMVCDRGKVYARSVNRTYMRRQGKVTPGSWKEPKYLKGLSAEMRKKLQNDVPLQFLRNDMGPLKKKLRMEMGAVPAPHGVSYVFQWHVMAVKEEDACGENPSKKSLKKARELRWNDLTDAQRAQFREAMGNEWQAWLDLGAVKIIRPADAAEVSPDRIRPTRFVLTWKEADGKRSANGHATVM